MDFQLFQPQAIHELGKRTNQEDSIYPAKGEATTANRIFLVCDGMGGHDKGEVASAAVCQGLSQKAEALLKANRTFTDNDFNEALTEAFDTLDRADTEHQGRMGTTMTFVCLHKGGALVAHIGDSRIYHLRPATGEVLYRSRDHSLVQQLYELGEISYNEMGTSPRKNVILRAMQPYQEERTKPTIVHITDIRPGDYFYQCSDGMLEQMEDDELLSIVSDPALSEEQKVEQLIARTIDNSDNHTAYLVKVAEVVMEAGDDQQPSDEAEARRRNKALNDPHKDIVWDYRPDGSPAPSAAPAPVQKAAPAPPIDQPAAPAPQPSKPAGNKATQPFFKDSRKWPLLALLLIVVVGIIIWLAAGSSSASEDEEEEATEQSGNQGKEQGEKPIDAIDFKSDGNKGEYPPEEENLKERQIRGGGTPDPMPDSNPRIGSTGNSGAPVSSGSPTPTQNN